MNYLDFKNITFSYENKKILDNFSFSIKKGEILLIKGASGIGKSTILRLISGLEKVDSGKIYLDSKDITNELIEKRNVAYLFQDFALFPHMTVYKNIEYAIKTKNKEEKKEKIMKLLKMVNLEEFKDRSPLHLSGGEKQRVALIRSLANEPKLLLLDEPFSSLDEELRDKLRKEVRDILKKLNVTAIIVSHDIKDKLISDKFLDIK